MQLVSFSCDGFAGLRLKEISFQSQNLIVGKNATGKSRLLKSLDFVLGILSQRMTSDWYGEFKLTFEDGLDEFIYSVKKDKVISETFYKNETLLLKREGNNGKIKGPRTADFDHVFPPAHLLLIHTRRDTHLYPDIEKIIQWASNAHIFLFGGLTAINATESSAYTFTEHGVDAGLVTFYRVLSLEKKAILLAMMNEMGYDIKAIEAMGFDINTGEARRLSITETNLDYEIPHIALSQGMIRLLTLIAYLLCLTPEASLILIDDLGEGLDYNRAFKLGKFVFDECKKADVQLIATSNDSFLMNAIPIEYWNLLQRSGSDITAVNKKNSPQLFDDFSYSGLSNFDFLSSDYVDSYKK